jgi:hypothetical protein
MKGAPGAGCLSVLAFGVVMAVVTVTVAGTFRALQALHAPDIIAVPVVLVVFYLVGFRFSAVLYRTLFVWVRNRRAVTPVETD